MSNFLGSTVYNNFEVFLRFSLYPGASNNVLNLWDCIRHKLFPSKRSMNNSLSITRGDIYLKWKDNCMLKSNREIPIMDYNEGDLGIDDMRIYKRIHRIEPCKYYPHTGSREYFNGIDGEIRMKVIDGIDQRWSLEEIQDLLLAFTMTCNEYLREDDACHSEIIIQPNLPNNASLPKITFGHNY